MSPDVLPTTHNSCFLFEAFCVSQHCPLLLPRAAHSAQLECKRGASTTTTTLASKPALRHLPATYHTGSCYLTACVCVSTIRHGGNFKHIFQTATFKPVNFCLLTSILCVSIYAYISISCYLTVNVCAITSGTAVILNVHYNFYF